MNRKIVHELQKPDEKFTNLPCNELFHIFHQIITTNINYFVLTKNREKRNQKNWIYNEIKNMPEKKRNYNTYYIRSDSNNHEANFLKIKNAL